MANQTSTGVVILAAGLGKRMRSALPKVLHLIGGKPLLFHIIKQICESKPGIPIAIVVGHGREKVESTIRGEPAFQGLSIEFVLQPEQRGTGDALRCALDSPWGKAQIAQDASLLVLPGDAPLIPGELIQEMTQPLKPSEELRLLSCQVSDPTGYGRIIREAGTGRVLRIVEEKDASPEQREVREVGVSIYLFRSSFLKESLSKLSDQNAQGEYYLTDLVETASQSHRGIHSLIWKNEEELRGINDPWELSESHYRLNQRSLKKWALNGVHFVDSKNTWVDVTVEIAPGVSLSPGVVLQGLTRIEEGSVLGPGVHLKDVQVGRNVILKTGTVAERSTIEAGAQVGPYAHLRPESLVGASAKIGNFVELKKTRVGENTSIAHLSYLGDAEVGRNVNIGCGFVTCNFDGRIIQGSRKHKTVIEDDAFVGSDCQVIAPVRIGKGAFVASGSTITEDVPAESLAIARSRQINKPGYAPKLRDPKVE